MPCLFKIFLRRNFLSSVKKNKKVCLTFDDGPNPKSTPEILRLLEKANTKATFFVIGENAEKYPDLILSITKQGHEIGEHSYQHSHPWKCGPIQSIKDQLWGYRSFRRFCCSGTQVLFRPPYGKLNLITYLYIILFRRRVVFWNVNPRDYEQRSADAIFRYVKNRLTPGVVILLHDGRRNSSQSSDVATTITALKLILKESEQRGLNLTTVSGALTNDTETNNLLSVARK